MRHAPHCTRRQAVLLLAGIAWSTACGRHADDQPVAISYGRDECAWCRMTVDDPALATEWISPKVQPRIFGEPGCLLAWLSTQGEVSGTAWVRVPDSDQWLRATDAWFVHGVVKTPMSFNLSALGAAPTGTESLTWSQLRQKGMPDARPS